MLRFSGWRPKNMASARVAVRHHMPLHFKMLIWIAIFVTLIAAGVICYRVAYQAGMQDSGRVVLPEDAQMLAARQSAQMTALNDKILAMEQRLRVETATHDSLARQLQQLNVENGTLRDQVAFYESLLTRSTSNTGMTVESFRAEAIAESRYRIGMVIVQGQAKANEFHGEVDFSLSYELNGQRSKLVKPVPRMAVSVVRFHRVESEVTIPAGAKLKQVEVRIYGAGENRPKLSRNFEVKG